VPYRPLALASLLASIALLFAAIEPAEAVSSGFPEGPISIVDRQPLAGFNTPYSLMDLSRSGGRFVSFTWRLTSGRERLGLIDLNDDSLRFIATIDDTDVAPLSPDASLIAIRQGLDVVVVNVSDGSTQVQGQSARGGPIQWLIDGRLSYLDSDRALVFQPVGGIPQSAGFQTPDPPGPDDLASSVQVSPDGTLVLYSRRCQAHLLDLGSSTTTTLTGADLSVPVRAWAPDGSRFVAQHVSWTDHCRSFGLPPVNDILFSSDGTRVGAVLGSDLSLSTSHTVSWSPLGHWLLIGVQPTGTEVAGFEALYAANTDAQERSRVLKSRSIDTAFVGPNGRIVFSQYDRAKGASHGHLEGTVETGRLVES